ncbi:hypothetical protein [Kitasatospora sp. NPDC051705]|uniref:hypothetical protein n=1 Tax=Kitasatospora sp. NPDC051705 TaxID=3364057 RepID=UPI00378ED120
MRSSTAPTGTASGARPGAGPTGGPARRLAVLAVVHLLPVGLARRPGRVRAARSARPVRTPTGVRPARPFGGTPA